MNRSAGQLLRSPLFLIVWAALLWFIGAFLIYPNLRMLGQVFLPGGNLSFIAIERLSSSDRAMASLRNSLLLAIVLSVTVNAVGIFIVLVTRYFDIRGSRILSIGYATTLIYGGIVLVAGYKFIYGQNGIVTTAVRRLWPGLDAGWFSGMFAVAFVMTFASTGYHLLFLSSAMAKVDFSTIEAAKMMGASNWSVLRSVVLPTLRPMIFAITILTFLGGLGALAAPQVLGGQDFQTITPLILAFASAPSSRDLAATLAIVLGLATIVLLMVMNKLEKGGTYFSVSKVPATMKKQKIENPVVNAIVHAVAYVLFAVYTLPPLLIIIFSFTDSAAIQSASLSWDSFTLSNYAQVFTDYTHLWPLLVSIGYSAAATAVVVFGMLFVARIVQRYRNPITSAIQYLLLIPWILPSTMIALGLIIAFDHSEWMVGNAVLTGTVSILAIAYVIVKIPFTMRVLQAAYASVPDQLEEAAAILGASTFTTFRRVLFPIVAPTAAAVAALNFNSLLDDYDMAVFLSHPLYQPLGIVIKNATTSETLNDATALTFVYTVILMVITGTTMYLVYGRTSHSRGSERHRRAQALEPEGTTHTPTRTLVTTVAAPVLSGAIQEK
ncbi:iron ABC transporter permease [Rhodococcus sp. NKCM2511]|uniref:ABC transporter permease n=1 Tax=Rhodococcus sp. NKCM2511 TaxID=2766011 RepID=UPI0019107480|nr:iron ABC transporter permease [Rhodococcus sp. NKCM2511]GHP19153.1 iron ABC transporter permease [Rhodococcus sp. NKCM2511]